LIDFFPVTFAGMNLMQRVNRHPESFVGAAADVD